MEEFVNAIANLRADELVADAPPDLKPYGLDRPEARWRFQASDKDMLDVLICGRGKPEGGKEREGPRCYAKLATGDLLFLLRPQLTSKAPGEHPSRTLCTTL